MGISFVYIGMYGPDAPTSPLPPLNPSENFMPKWESLSGNSDENPLANWGRPRGPKGGQLPKDFPKDLLAKIGPGGKGQWPNWGRGEDVPKELLAKDLPAKFGSPTNAPSPATPIPKGPPSWRPPRS
jgi:hypothetical protein